MKTISIVKQWMSLATVEEQQLLAERAGTSRGYLYQLAGGHRQASAELGAAIERESKFMAKASKGRLPIIYRTDIVAACRACDFAQKCLGERAVVSDFPIVDASQLELGV
jgi:hypothetical protein